MSWKLKLAYLAIIFAIVSSGCNEGGDRSIINSLDKGSGGLVVILGIILLALFFIAAYFLDRRGKNKKKDLPQDENKGQ